MGNQMEKAFVLKSAVPELATNGRIAVYSTLDLKVNMIVILGEFDWKDRNKSEVFRCARCRCYIFPDDKSKAKDGKKYHKICPAIKKIPEIENVQIPEIQNGESQ